MRQSRLAKWLAKQLRRLAEWLDTKQSQKKQLPLTREELNRFEVTIRTAQEGFAVWEVLEDPKSILRQYSKLLLGSTPCLSRGDGPCPMDPL